MSASLDKEGLAEVCRQLAKAYEEEWREADKLVQQGVQEERKRIVAWLRKEAADILCFGAAIVEGSLLDQMEAMAELSERYADRIEAGGHLK